MSTFCSLRLLCFVLVLNVLTLIGGILFNIAQFLVVLFKIFRFTLNISCH